eukprot:CAMPEP_0194267904 /NCGR_PEP_ID=MMETSP0169-20130528/2323_1 /TAXON_ID=218684 /ORGANISM="Corethron pennatum, Strain L29A3" /LENGTH=76 /DNA_ID=CAMNT_0039008927 /DNA_START=385 /DNA_END=615 /DNA_ORIENTATION=-
MERDTRGAVEERDGYSGADGDKCCMCDGDKLRMRDLLDVLEATQPGFCARELSRSTTLLGVLHAGLWERVWLGAVA